MSRLARFAQITLAYNVAVILWGAYVRATGSGAGCGSHWPLCNGEVLPRAASVETLVEFSHRVTSGLALVAVVVLCWWTWRGTPRRHPARAGAAWTLALMITEAAVGAGLVLFQLVADNASMARALFMGAHLINTFFLLAALALTAHWLADGARIQTTGRPEATAAILAGAVGLLLVGVSGAIASLGDTLFPSASLADALGADLSPTSHLLIRLRVLHPALAVVVGLGLAATAHRLPIARHDRRGRAAASAVAVLALAQLGLGFVNVMLLAPVWLQLLHLLLADALWLAFVLAGACTLSERPAALARDTAGARSRALPTA
jgi:heme A synthase